MANITIHTPVGTFTSANDTDENVDAAEDFCYENLNAKDWKLQVQLENGESMIFPAEVLRNSTISFKYDNKKD